MAAGPGPEMSSTQVNVNAPVSAAPSSTASPQAKKPDNSIWHFLQLIGAHLVVAVLVAVTTYAWTSLHEKKKVEEAPRLYVEELDKLINTAVDEGEDNAIVNARAIVSARNSLSHSLSAIGTQLDSQIDLIALEVQMETIVPTRSVEPNDSTLARSRDKHEVYMQIIVLKKIWPAKKRQIEVELRKLLAELGLYGSNDEK